VATATLGTGGYLLERLWVGRRSIVTFPLLAQFQQQPKDVRELMLPSLRSSRIAWSSDGKRALTFVATFYVESWDAFSGKHLLTYTFPTLDFAWSPDSKYLALLDPIKGTPAIVSAQDGTQVAASWAQNVFVPTQALCVAWSPDGKRIAIGGALLDKKSQGVKGVGILSYDALTGLNQQIYETRWPGGLLNSVVWSPNGRYLVGIGEADVQGNNQLPGYLFVWEAESGRLIFFTPANHWSSMAWSPDNERLAVAYENSVEVWQPFEARKLVEYHGHPAEVWSIAWSPDGKHIASASNRDGLVHVWEASTGQLRYLYQGHDDTVTDISWSPNSTYLLSCDQRSNAVHIWQPQV
jgi:WD40 repeat protein